MMVLKISSCIIQVLLLLIWQALALEVEHIRLLDSYSLLLGASLSSSFKVSPGSEYYSVMVCDQSNNNDCNSDTFW